MQWEIRRLDDGRLRPCLSEIQERAEGRSATVLEILPLTSETLYRIEPEAAGIPISARDRPVTASSNQTFSRKVACFTRPSNVVREGTSDRRACSSVSPSRQ